MILEERRTSRAHWALCASTSSTPCSRQTAVARCSAVPTDAFHAKSTLPGESGEPRRSSASARGTAAVSGSMGQTYYSPVRLILASASPRRAELLRAAGFDFDVRVTDIDEAPRAGESPREYVSRVAREKGAAAETGHDGGGDAVILAADTTVVVDGDILGKPIDDDDARRMLARLSGRAHEVLTGVSVRLGADEQAAVESTVVWFKPLTNQEIAWYVASGECRDKAGAYAIQGLASRFIPRIDGSYSNVVGLPVATVHRLLAGIGGGGGKKGGDSQIW